MSQDRYDDWMDALLAWTPALAAGAGAGVAALAAWTAPSQGWAFAVCLGGATFAGLLSLRSWFMADRAAAELESDRAALAEDLLLITEELLEVDERLSRRAADADTLRTLLGELTGIVEDALTERDGAATPEAAKPETPSQAPADAAPASADLHARLAAQEERARKLAQAVKLAVNAARELQARVDDLERAEAQPEAPRAQTAPPVETASAAAPTAEVVELQPRAAERAREEARAEARAEARSLYLQPICDLISREPVFFDAFAARDGAAGTADPEQEAALLARSVDVMTQLQHDGRNLGVICDLSPDALRDDAVLVTFEALKARGADRLVVEFAQSDIAQLSPQAERALRAAHARGLTFSLDGVSDWSLDLDRLRDLGFRFLKLDCAEFLTRVRAAGGTAAPLMARLRDRGLELILSGVDDPAELQELAAAGAVFGQGAAVAEARALRAA